MLKDNSFAPSYDNMVSFFVLHLTNLTLSSIGRVIGI